MPALEGYASFSPALDENGNSVYIDDLGEIYNTPNNRGILKNTVNYPLAQLANFNEMINEQNTNSPLYKEKALLGLSLMTAPLGLEEYATTGLFSKFRPVFNPKEIDINRRFFNELGAMNYLRKTNPNIKIENSLIDNIYHLPSSEKKVIRTQGKNFAKDNFIGNSINVPGYTTVNFTNKNLGEDYLHNLSEYPTLFEKIRNSEYKFSTNYKKEKDRLYDHLINSNDNNLYDYLIEVIKDSEGKIHHNYKMMKNIKKGDKP